MGKNNKATKKTKEVEDVEDVEVDEIDEVEPVDDTTNTEGQVLRSYSEISEELQEKLKQCAQLDREIRQLFKEKERAHNREIKNARKNRKSNNANKGSKEPSGFNKPGPVPKEFCMQPWGCDASVQLPRTVLTKMVYDYIKEHELQDEADKRIIHPDNIIKRTFHLQEGDTLEFKTFQTYMAKLYNPSPQTQTETITVDDESDEEDVKKKAKSKSNKKKSKSVEATV